ncbi:UPF0223 family protein [Aerococcaceae bacterium DSM 111021]|nr:UPF0223 family protein [Aerococcaceae bacterium DSM 111021]
MKNYNYPIDTDWTNDEIVIVITFLNAVELAYEKGIHIEEYQKAYKRFKEVVPSKSEEKQIGNKFEELSGYSLYRTVQLMRSKLKETSLNKKAQIMRMDIDKRRA